MQVAPIAAHFPCSWLYPQRGHLLVLVPGILLRNGLGGPRDVIALIFCDRPPAGLVVDLRERWFLLLSSIRRANSMASDAVFVFFTNSF